MSAYQRLEYKVAFDVTDVESKHLNTLASFSCFVVFNW